MSIEAGRRSVALASFDRFKIKNGLTDVEMAEVHAPGRVDFIGTTTDGRRFSIGYLRDQASCL